MLAQFIINGFIVGILYSMSAIGFALVYNITRIFHIAAAAIYVVAAYIFFFFGNMTGLPIWLSALLAIVLTALLSTTCEWVVYRPLSRKKSSPAVAMISSIGIMTVLVNLVAIIFGNETKIIEHTVQRTLKLGEIIVTRPQLLQLVIGGVTLAAFVVILRFTRFGLKTKALANNSVLFETMGFSVARMRTWIFALSGSFIALGSCLAVYDVGMNPHMGMTLLLNAMVAMIIGGSARFEACIIGGISLGIVQSLVVYLFSASWQNAVTFVVLLLFLFFKPQGISGYNKRVV